MMALIGLASTADWIFKDCFKVGVIEQQKILDF
jgi:hypothetical protein